MLAGLERFQSVRPVEDGRRRNHGDFDVVLPELVIDVIVGLAAKLIRCFLSSFFDRVGDGDDLCIVPRPKVLYMDVPAGSSKTNNTVTNRGLTHFILQSKDVCSYQVYLSDDRLVCLEGQQVSRLLLRYPTSPKHKRPHLRYSN